MSAEAYLPPAEKTERLLGLRPPQPWPWPRRELIAALLSPAVVVVGISVVVILSFILEVDGRQRWLWIAIGTQQATLLAVRVADALYAGASGGRFVERGRRVRAVAYPTMHLAGVLVFAAIGYLVAGSTGALVGGAASLVLLLITVRYDRRHQDRARDASGTAGSG